MAAQNHRRWVDIVIASALLLGLSKSIILAGDNFSPPFDEPNVPYTEGPSPIGDDPNNPMQPQLDPCGPLAIGGNPVQFATGVKVEGGVDLVVPLPGRDFMLHRSYLSKPGVNLPRLSGANWSFNVMGFASQTHAPYVIWDDFDTLDVHANNEYYVSIFESTSMRRFWPETMEEPETVWRPGGPTTQFAQRRVIASDANAQSFRNVTTVALIEPGRWEKHYFRPYVGEERDPPSTWPDLNGDGIENDRPFHDGVEPQLVWGWLAEERDTTGNRWVYDYEAIQTVNYPDGRLETIRCIDREGDLNARIEFEWIDAAPDLTAPHHGRLRRAKVMRPDGAGNFIEVQRVVYFYVSDFENAHWHTGTPGDLVLVVNYDRVDRGATISEEPVTAEPIGYAAAVRVRHYRYHGGVAPPGGGGGSGEDTIGVVEEGGPESGEPGGQPHQLKMVIDASGVELLMRWRNIALSPQTMTLNELLGWLMTQHDHSQVFSDAGVEFLLVDLATKVMQEYEDAPPYRLLTQYIKPGAGGGGKSFGKRLEYGYIQYGSGTGVYSNTTTVDEWGRPCGETEFTAHLGQRRYDFRRLGNPRRHQDPSVPYVINAVQSDLSDPQDPKHWVMHHVYDQGRRYLIRKALPSATEWYVPKNEFDLPDYDAKNDSGRVEAYVYNSRGRLIEVRDRKGGGTMHDEGPGFSDEDSVLRWKATYDHSVLEHLPTRIDRFRMAVNTAAEAHPDDVETTWLRYGLRANTFDDFGINDGIAWLERQSEKALPTENGPVLSGGEPATESRFVILDGVGEPQWTVSPSGQLSKSIAQASTSLRTAIHQNAALDADWPTDSVDLPSDIQLDAAISEAGITLDTSANGGTLERRWTRDLMGRIVEVVSPGDVRRSITRETRPLEGWPAMELLAVVEIPHKIKNDPAHPLDDSWAGPATVRWHSASGGVVQASGFEPIDATTNSPPHSGYETFVSSYTLGDELSRSRLVRNESQLVIETLAWSDVANDVSHRTQYVHDPIGRLAYSIDPTGGVEYHEYDSRDRLHKMFIGTTDPENPADLFAAPGNLIVVQELFYDSDGLAQSGVGDGGLTLVRRHASDTEVRDTVFERDYRGRMIATERADASGPYVRVTYDNLDRVVMRETFGNEPATAPGAANPDRARVETYLFDQQGRPWQQRVGVDPRLSVNDSQWEYFASATWYNEDGLAIGQLEPNAPAVKIQHDGLGRPVLVSTTDRGGDYGPGIPGSLASTLDLIDDVVLEETAYSYTDDGLIELVTTARRTHDATATGSLQQIALTKPEAVIQSYAARWYDEANRLIAQADYGTNSDVLEAGQSAPTIDPGAPPTPGDPGVIVQRLQYDRRGLATESQDPDGQWTRIVIDDLGRTIATVENRNVFDPAANLVWESGLNRWTVQSLFNNPSWNEDEDRVTSFVYDGASRLVKRVSHGWDGGVGERAQETAYRYDSTSSLGSSSNPAASLVASADLLAEVWLPDEITGVAGGAAAGGSPDPNLTIKTAYNRLGERRYLQDQNGAERVFTLDAFGRVERDDVINWGAASTSQAVDAFVRTFDEFGRLVTASSEKNSQTLNQVKYDYSVQWLVEDVWQEHDGIVDSTSHRVRYTHEIEGLDNDISPPLRIGNRVRPASLVYPSDVGLGGAPDIPTVAYSYGADNAASDRINRIDGFMLGDDGGDPLAFDTLVQYDWIGLTTPARVDYYEADVVLDRQVHLRDDGSSDVIGSRTPGKYSGYDGFGRPRSQAWVDIDLSAHASDPSVPNIPPIVQLDYDFTSAGVVLEKRDGRPGAKRTNRDAVFVYDGLYRLQEALRGATNGAQFQPTSIVDTPSETWHLDVLGNWLTYGKDTDGSGSYAANETEQRSHNQVNELVDRTAGSGAVLQSTFDANGNMLSAQFETAVGVVTHHFTYDPWNRLVEVEVTPPGGQRTLQAKYTYNALGWRIRKQVSADDPSDGILEEDRRFYYSAHWQLLEEHIDEDVSAADGVDRIAQQFWGARHPDDAVMRRDRSFDDGAQSWGEWGTGLYYLTDVQGSPVALVSPSRNSRAVLRERITYSAYGVPRHHWGADVDGDGAVNSLDNNELLAAFGNSIGSASYNVDADINRDGEIGSIDNTSLLAQWSPALTAGALSAFDNAIGYGSYHHDSELLPGRFLARHRVYSPHLGRWQQRDPLGYVDGGNLYEYGVSSPAVFTDPLGLTVGGGGWQWLYDLIDSFTGGSNSAEGSFVQWLLDLIQSNLASSGGGGPSGAGGGGGELLATIAEATGGGGGGGLTLEEKIELLYQLGAGGDRFSIEDTLLEDLLPLAPEELTARFQALLDSGSNQLEVIQLFLDAAGFAPGIGIFADVANAAIYAANGNYVMASANLAAAVPVIGDALKGGVLAAKLGRAAARGHAFERAALETAGLAPNTKHIDGVTLTGNPGRSKPDSLSNNRITEVKDRDYVYNSRQLQIQSSASNNLGKPHDLIVSPRTRVSKPLQFFIKRSGGVIRVFDIATNSFSPFIP